MKRAVSISIGTSKRNKAVEIELLGEKVSIERIGTDGDMEKAAQLYRELDGKVDAFLVGQAADQAGQDLIREWTHFIRRTEARARVIFLSDYDMLLTEHLVQGVVPDA